MPEVNITSEQGNDTQAHIDAMVAAADGKQAPAQAPAGDPEQKPERPAWLPAKFETPEAMAEAYAAMERKQSAPKETPAGDPEVKPAGDPAVDPNEASAAADAAVQAAGLDMDALANKFIEKGDLEASDYEALAKQGISKDMVNNYVQGQQAIADRLVTEMHDTVGGQENFDSLLDWAKDNLDAAEIAAFNDTVDNGSNAAIKMALQGLQARHVAEAGSAPALVGGRRGGPGGGDVFRSTAEVTRAMGDPRYTNDPAYRADVMAKLGRSNVM